VTGRLLGHDTFTVQLLDSRETLRSFDKQDLRAQTFLGSTMPSYRGALTAQELADVVRYLSSQATGR
jgi:mono/diheme cytochrome c family protein